MLKLLTERHQTVYQKLKKNDKKPGRKRQTQATSEKRKKQQIPERDRDLEEAAMILTAEMTDWRPSMFQLLQNTDPLS